MRSEGINGLPHIVEQWSYPPFFFEGVLNDATWRSENSDCVLREYSESLNPLKLFYLKTQTSFMASSVSS